MKTEQTLERLARESWQTSGSKRRKYDPKVVAQIYKTAVQDESGVGLLEQLEYLEAYLWPHFDAKSSVDHVASIAVLAAKIDDPWSKYCGS